MDRSACIDLLNHVLHGTVNSVVQYIDISGAYVPKGYEEKFEAIRRMKTEEAESAHSINVALAELDGTPKVGVFEYWNVDLNYLDLRFLARFAADHQEKVIRALESRIEAARDFPQVYSLLRDTLEQKRAHLEELREIAG